MRRFILIAGLLATCAGSAWAQPTAGVEGTGLIITGKSILGSDTPSPSLLPDVLRLIGVRDVVNGAATIRPLVIDNDGDVLNDTNNTVSTAGLWTFATSKLFVGANTGTGLFNVNGAAGSDKGIIFNDAGTEVARLAAVSSALTLTGRSLTTSNTSPFLRLIDFNAGTNLTTWDINGDGGQIAVRALTDALGSPTDLWRGYRSTGTANVFEIGGAVNLLGFATNMFTDVGSYVKKVKGLYVSELVADVFTVIEKQVIGNGSFRIGRGTTLSRDLSNSATTIFVKRPVFRYLDFPLMQGLNTSGQPQFESLRITSGATDCTGAISPLPAACSSLDNDDYAYSVERNKDQGSANSWIVGDGLSSTDVYLDEFAWTSGVISGGGAIMGDRPQFYLNFDTGTTTEPQRAATSGSVTASAGVSAVTPASAFPNNGDGGAWNRTTDGAYFTTAVPSLNSGNQATVLACTFSLELVYYINGTTPGSSDHINPVVKWTPGSEVSTATFAMYHFGSAAGGNNGKMAVYATPAAGSTLSQIGAFITPAAGWHHLVFTYNNGNGGRWFVDGAATGSVTAPLSGTGCAKTNTSDVSGQLWGVNGNSFGGYISELAVYSYSLSPEAIKAHYDAFQTNRPGLTAGPTIVGYERTDDTNWYGVSERWACGNLAGLYGYTQKTYGCAWGDSGSTWVGADATNGFRILNGSTEKFKADTSGNLSLTGDLTIGTNGVFRSAAATALGTGTGLYMAGGTTPVFRVGDPTGNRLHWDGTTLTVVSSNLTIGSSGALMAAKANSGYNNGNSYGFSPNGLTGTPFGMFGYDDGTFRNVQIANIMDSSTTGKTAIARMSAGRGGVEQVSMDLTSSPGLGNPDRVVFTGVDQLDINGSTGFSGTKVAGSCTITFTLGIVTNVTGC